MAVHEDWTHVQNQSLLLWAEDIDTWAQGKGWNDNIKFRTEGDWAALAHSEISEALEAFRTMPPPEELCDGETPLMYTDADGKLQGMAVEYADCVIRILHWCKQHDVNLGEVMALKMAYNEGRPYRHGDKAL